MTTENPTSMLR